MTSHSNHSEYQSWTNMMEFNSPLSQYSSPIGDWTEPCAAHTGYDTHPQQQRTTFDPSQHTTISPNAFDVSAFSTSFVPPRFLSGGVGASLPGGGVNLIEPQCSTQAQNEHSSTALPYTTSPAQGVDSNWNAQNQFDFSFGNKQNAPNFSAVSTESVGMMGPPPIPFARQASTFGAKAQNQMARRPSNSGQRATENPVYAPYGSSVISVQELAYAKYAIPPSPSTFSHNPTSPSPAFDPAKLGLPIPAGQGNVNNHKGLYSSTGFDMVGILSRVASRPNPRLAIGPVDLGCSFIVVDAKKFDQPIVFASETFTRLTGYSNAEIVGQNCRFLQSPTGQVTQGEKRVYTDGNAAHHLRQHVIAGKESQASLINYCKGGKPFINLVTLIPITWDSDEISYFVGFQVDLVEQPAAIMEKMKNGSYVIDYRLVNSNLPPQISAPSLEMSLEQSDDVTCTAATSHSDRCAVIEPSNFDQPDELLDKVLSGGVESLGLGKKQFNRMLLENTNDFVHVLSLKGSLLYVSPSAKKYLEYDPQELTGKTLSSFCHPSDIVAILRELKESGSVSHPQVNLVYRIRRKHSGYMWIEAQGRLHMEQGKGRKCVILVGRPRQVYKMSWAALERLGGFGEKEFWSKLTTSGLFLYTTAGVRNVLGHTADTMTGKSVSDFADNGEASQLKEAIKRAAKGEPVTVRHSAKSKTGTTIDLVTHFYPCRSSTDELSDVSLGKPLTIIAQTNLFSSEIQKKRNISLPSAPSSRSNSAASSSSGSSSFSGASGSDVNSSRTSAASSPSLLALPNFNLSHADQKNDSNLKNSTSSKSTTSFSAITSTFKTLHSDNISDNVFDELDSVRGTSWQFELHQLRLTNKRLREEKEALTVLQKKKRKREAGSHSSGSGSASGATPGVRSCLNCGRTNSAEWRTGPTGPKTLCNACGLRWAKSSRTVRPGAKPLQKTTASHPICPLPTPPGA